MAAIYDAPRIANPDDIASLTARPLRIQMLDGSVWEWRRVKAWRVPNEDGASDEVARQRLRARLIGPLDRAMRDTVAAAALRPARYSWRTIGPADWQESDIHPVRSPCFHE